MVLKIEDPHLFVSVLTLSEIHKGIEKLPEGKKKEKLHKLVSYDLKERFRNRIIDFDLQTATVWGEFKLSLNYQEKVSPQ